MINISLKQKILLAKKYKKTAWHALTDKILFHEKPAPFPRLINLFVTEKCNFTCPMCHVKESRQKYQSENLNNLTPEILEPLIEESKFFSPAFQIIGGEPLLAPQIFETIKMIAKYKMPKGLTTNGLLLEKYAKDIIESGLDFLSVSLDGPEEETQYQRGYVAGSFDQITVGIKKILSLRGKNLLPNIRIATVVSSFNIINFEKILDVAENLGADQWSLSHYFYYYDKIGEAQDDFNKKYHLGPDIWGDYNKDQKTFFNDEEISMIKEKYNKIYKIIKNKKTSIKISIQKNLDIEKYYKGYMPSKESRCASPYYQVFIRGNGDVEMCQGYILGNIKQDSLKNIWNNKKSRHFRKVFKKTGLTPACFRCCALDIKFD